MIVLHKTSISLVAKTAIGHGQQLTAAVGIRSAITVSVGHKEICVHVDYRAICRRTRSNGFDSSWLNRKRRHNSRAIKSFESRARPPPRLVSAPLIHGPVALIPLYPLAPMLVSFFLRKNREPKEAEAKQSSDGKKRTKGGAAGPRNGRREPRCFNLSTGGSVFLCETNYRYPTDKDVSFLPNDANDAEKVSLLLVRLRGSKTKMFDAAYRR